MRLVSATILTALALSACIGPLAARTLPLESDWLTVMLRKAEQGDAIAQYMLGNMYEKGNREVPKDPEEADKWYRRSFLCSRLVAEEGQVFAQLFLGRMYKNGIGTSQNHKAAIRWYIRAAAQGDVDAQVALGKMFRNGDGVPQDYGKAIMWHRRAAAQGDRRGQLALGLMYKNGEGVPQDYTKAYTWTKLSLSKAGGKARTEFLAPLAARMTSEQLGEAKRLVREYNRKWNREWKLKRKEQRKRHSHSIRCVW